MPPVCKRKLLPFAPIAVTIWEFDRLGADAERRVHPIELDEHLVCRGVAEIPHVSVDRVRLSRPKQDRLQPK
jgi:hypothetical protein